MSNTGWAPQATGGGIRQDRAILGFDGAGPAGGAGCAGGSSDASSRGSAFPYNPPVSPDPSSRPSPVPRSGPSSNASGGSPRHLAIYTGSFDPITFGHLDVLARSRRLFDEVILAIGRNPNKAALFSFEERLELATTLIDELVAREPEGARVRVETYAGLTVDFAQQVGAVAIIRGIRNVTDLASECQLAITNRQVAAIETVFIVTGEAFAYTSSSLIQQIAALGGSLDKLRSLVPPIVVDALRAKRDAPNNPLRRLAQDQLAE